VSVEAAAGSSGAWRNQMIPYPFFFGETVMAPSDNGSVEAAVKEFILTEFLPGEAPEALTNTTALITTGILDSIGTLKLVSFLEQRFKIGVVAHEANVDYLNTVADIARLVRSKQGGNAA
jgi:acyl carrier protein